MGSDRIYLSLISGPTSDGIGVRSGQERGLTLGHEEIRPALEYLLLVYPISLGFGLIDLRNLLL